MTIAKKTTVADRIAKHRPCRDAMEFARGYTSAAKAWRECQRPDWMLWILAKSIGGAPWSDERKPLVACCLDCACTVKHLWPKDRAEKTGTAVEVMRQWTKGKASMEQAQQARRDLRAAASAAYAAYAAAREKESRSAAKSFAAANTFHCRRRCENMLTPISRSCTVSASKQSPTQTPGRTAAAP